MAVTEVYDANGNLLSRVDTDPNGNENTIRQQALAAMATNRAAITRNTASVAVANPTNAQVIAALKDALRQLSDLERQNNALIRLALNLMDGTD